MRFGALQLPHLSLYQVGWCRGPKRCWQPLPCSRELVEISKLIAVVSLRQHPSPPRQLCLSMLLVSLELRFSASLPLHWCNVSGTDGLNFRLPPPELGRRLEFGASLPLVPYESIQQAPACPAPVDTEPRTWKIPLSPMREALRSDIFSLSG